jgi:hypothetical protein
MLALLLRERVLDVLVHVYVPAIDVDLSADISFKVSPSQLDVS